MSDVAQNFSENQSDNDPFRELLATCDRSPLEGLEWIDRHLDADLKIPLIMFARFVALRHLALDGFFEKGAPNLGSATADEITRVITAENMAYAEQALTQVAEIDTAEPEYIENLRSEGDKFASRMVDDICIVIERLRPGEVQEVLGWTKLHYYGSERLGNVPDVFEQLDDDLIGAAIRTKIRPPQIARSALSYSKGEDNRNRRFVDVFLMEKCFGDTPTFGDANMFCSVRFFDDGEVLIDGSKRVSTAAPSEAGESQTSRRGPGFVSPNPFAILNESADWGGVDLREMPRQLHDSLVRPVLEQVDVLEARKKKKLDAARGSLEEGRRRLTAITNDLKKTKSTEEVFYKENLIFIKGFLQTAVEQGIISAAQRAEIIKGFDDRDQLVKHLMERYSKNMYVGSYEHEVKKLLRDIPVMFIMGGGVFIVGWILSLFFDWISTVLPILVGGVILYPIGKFAVEKFNQKTQRESIDASEANLLSKLGILDEIKEKTRQAMERLEESGRSTTDSVHREYAEVLGPLAHSARNFLANYGEAVSEKQHRAAQLAQDWGSEVWSAWRPATGSPDVVRAGKLTTKAVAGALRPTFPEVDFSMELPALAEFSSGAPILIKVDSERRGEAIGALQSVTARLLATIPPGKLRFTFIDPIGLGQNVAAFMPLGDYNESLITSRAWSESEHIDKRLKDLTEHVENVIQKYLRHEFKTIEEYNRQAHEVAEPYRVLVVFDFPVNFSEASARRLVSLVQNGPRCGVYPIILYDTSKPLVWGFSIKDLLQSTSVVQYKDGRFVWSEQPEDTFTLELDHPCPPELLNRIIKEVGEAAKENMTVVVPYAKVLTLAGLDPDHPQGWGQVGGAAGGAEASSAASVEIPLGPMGARKAQLLTLGKGTAHHALIAGRTGSGKSNLLHVIITTLALKYSPREVELYLIDFKKGVEFKSYANHALPHARVIAIESEREFGLSVLQGLDAEMQRRGEVFRAVAANDLAEYREKTNTQLPRIILIVDEFQEFFSEDDGIGRQAAGILDRLVRQGRSFGIHLLLGSQSLAGSYTLARATLDQMQIRIALPCSEADSRLILADDNPAARLLSRPGEAIYNAASGLVEGNLVFQVALFSDDDRDHYLQAIAQKSDGQRRPIIFEGHEPAALEACAPLAELLAAPDWPAAGKAAEVWLGEPVAMKVSTSVRLRRQGGANLLVVTREEEEGVGLLTACVLGLAAQHRPEAAKLYLLDLSTAEAPWSELAGDLADLLPHRIEVLGRRDLLGLLAELTAEIQRRSDDASSAKAWSGYLIIQGLHRARDLRPDPAQGYSFGDEEAKASPAEQFAKILREGPEVGIHTLIWCDTYLNLERTLESRALREFGYRVAGSMSQDDSMRLLDDAAAARLDRPHRLIKVDEDQVGVLEKFRPYRIPATAWLEHTAEMLRGRAR